MPPDFSWLDWSGHPSTLIGVLTLEAAYIYGAGNLRGRLGGASAVSIRQATCFTLGMFVIYLALNSPIHELSDRYLFSAHMVQHMLLLWIMPPLVIWGLPDWLIRPAISSPIRLKAAKILVHPLVCLAVFNGILVVWHLPAVYNGALAHHNLHIFQHLCFMAAGILMWWPVLSRLPELPRLPYGGQMLYLFLISLLPAIVGGIISFADSVVYDWYAEAPRLWGISPAVDQQIGGLIMKTAGLIVFVVALASVFFAWAGREEARQREREKARTPAIADASAWNTEDVE